MPTLARAFERRERGRGRKTGIELSEPTGYEYQPSIVNVPGPALLFLPEDVIKVWAPVGIMATKGFSWHRLLEEPTMDMAWLPAIRRALVRELKSVPEVVGLYSAYDSGLLHLWVLVSGYTPDLEYRVADATYKAWEREGLQRHELIITSCPDSIPLDASPDYASTTG